jgi:hypothetical protein
MAHRFHRLCLSVAVAAAVAAPAFANSGRAVSGLPEHAASPLAASVSAPRIEDAGPSGAPVEVALNRIIRIGPRPNFLETWRCAVTVQGDRYYSTGLTETGARARLQRITDQKFHCRRDRRFS